MPEMIQYENKKQKKWHQAAAVAAESSSCQHPGRHVTLSTENFDIEAVEAYWHN